MDVSSCNRRGSTVMIIESLRDPKEASTLAALVVALDLVTGGVQEVISPARPDPFTGSDFQREKAELLQYGVEKHHAIRNEMNEKLLDLEHLLATQRTEERRALKILIQANTARLDALLLHSGRLESMLQHSKATQR